MHPPVITSSTRPTKTNMQPANRPHPPGHIVGIDEAMIQDLVHAFYARVRKDPMLAPIFNAAIDDWDAHLDKLCRFWSSVVLMTGRYKGAPMQAHAAQPQISGAHFDRSLALFGETDRDRCPPVAAALFIDRAERIAQSLEMGLSLHRGRMLRIGERLAAAAPAERQPT